MHGLEHIISNGILDHFVDRTAPERAKLVDAGHRLRMPNFYLILGTPMLFATIVGCIGFITKSPSLITGIVLTAFMLPFVGVPAFMMFIYGLRHRVIVKEHTFTLRGPLRGTRTIGFSEIIEGRYSPVEMAVIITTVDGRKHRISPYLVGCKLLWRILRERTQLPISSWGIPYRYWL